MNRPYPPAAYAAARPSDTPPSPFHAPTMTDPAPALIEIALALEAEARTVDIISATMYAQIVEMMARSPARVADAEALASRWPYAWKVASAVLVDRGLVEITGHTVRIPWLAVALQGQGGAA